MQPRFHSKMQCYVLSVSYDFNRRRGQVVMDDDACTDMSGCTEVFESIDPEVDHIETGYLAGRLDTVYRKRNGEWAAR